MTKKVASGMNIHSQFRCFVVRSQTGLANYRTTVYKLQSIKFSIQHLNTNMAKNQTHIHPASPQDCK